MPSKKRLSHKDRIILGVLGSMHLRICDGTATFFDLKALADERTQERHNRYWKSPCNYFVRKRSLKQDNKCDLLVQKSFKKLCDDQHGRCTWPVLYQLVDFFVQKYDYSNIFYQKLSGDKVKFVGAKGFPDIGNILRRCERVNWHSGDVPRDWFRYLSVAAYHETVTELRKTARCRYCEHFSRVRKWCTVQAKEVRSGDQACENDFKLIVFDPSVVRPPEPRTVMDQIYDRILMLFAEKTRKYPTIGRFKVRLIIAQEILGGEFDRKELAKRVEKAPKTIDRMRKDISARITRMCKTDRQLVDLLDEYDEETLRLADYPAKPKPVKRPFDIFSPDDSNDASDSNNRPDDEDDQ